MVITINGKFGCGAKEIADLLAKKTGYRIITDEMIKEATQALGIDTSTGIYKYYDESMGESSLKDMKRFSNISRIYRSTIGTAGGNTTPIDDNMDLCARKVLNQFADDGNCIIKGHCANYYLRGRNDVINLFISDNDAERISRVSEHLNMSKEEANKAIKTNDKRRAEYYEYFSKENWNADNYDLRLHTSTLGDEGWTDLVNYMIKLKEK